MIRISRVLSLILAVFAASVSLSSAQAAAKSAPAAAKFYPMVGKWHGMGQLVEPGQTPVKLTMTFNCRKVAAGWGVACDMKAKNKSMSISESDLMGVDPVTGKAHWYAVTNQGETHDHIAEWTDANTMHAQYTWTQDGKQMQETIQFNFKKRALTFSSVVTMDGQTVGEFSGELKH